MTHTHRHKRGGGRSREETDRRGGEAGEDEEEERRELMKQKKKEGQFSLSPPSPSSGELKGFYFSLSPLLSD